MDRELSSLSSLASLASIVGASVVLSGVTMAALTLAYGAPKMAPYRIREEAERRLTGPSFAWRIVLNGAFSGAIVFGLALGLRRFLFTTAEVSFVRASLEIVGVLIVYDFLYYLLHRFPFHQWGYLERVHAVHHMARYPRAIDSLYLHPIENVLGLALLFFCTWLVGPVSVVSFAVIAFVYTQLNVIVHSGLDLPRPFSFLGSMAKKHELHHRSMRGKNFASITPLPDLLFGTRE